MDNNKLPAYPIDEKDYKRFTEDSAPWNGFTKLELASLMIAQGIVQRDFQDTFKEEHWKDIAGRSVAIAKAVLEEANK